VVPNCGADGQVRVVLFVRRSGGIFRNVQGRTDQLQRFGSECWSGFKSAIEDVTTGNTAAAIYPGVGLEGFLGPIGLRADVGDEIYFKNGTHNNLRVTFDPTIRF
jgi:hypothetical protein